MSTKQLKLTIYSSILLAILNIHSVYSQNYYGIINDTDGYTNIRSKPSSSSEIKAKIFDYEFFQVLDKSKDWWLVKTTDAVKGYMHRSRVRIIEKYIRNNREYEFNNFEIGFNTKSLKNIDVRITNIKSKGLKIGGNDFFFNRAWIEIFKDNKKLDEVYFDDMDLERAGVYHTDHPLKNKIILKKFGDYSGMIYIIDEKGEKFEFSGGDFLITENQKFIISPWNSDLPGLTVINIDTNKAVFDKSTTFYPFDWYLIDGRYYVKGEDPDNNIDKIFYLDFIKGELIPSDLKKLDMYKEFRLDNWYKP